MTESLDKCIVCGAEVEAPYFDKDNNPYCEDCWLDRVTSTFEKKTEKVTISNVEIIKESYEGVGELTEEFSFDVAYENKTYNVKGYVVDATESDSYNIYVECEGERLSQAYVDSTGGMEGSESLSVGVPVVDSFIMYHLFAKADSIIKGF